MEHKLLTDLDPELARDMHYNMRIRERDLPHYLMKSPFLYQRRAIVQFIYGLGETFSLSEDTVFTAVAYFDRFSDSVDIPLPGLNLAAMACMLLAAKWEEREEDAPLLSHLTRVCGERYSVRELQLMEMVILDFMGWSLTTVVPTSYLPYYARSSMAPTDAVRFVVPSLQALEALVADRALYILSYAFLDFTMLRFPPSVLAASAVITARSILGITPSWAPSLLAASGFAEQDLMECVQRLWSLAGKAPQDSPVNRHEMAAAVFAPPAPPPQALPLLWDQCV